MPSLRTKPNTSTPSQWRAIHVLARDRGLSRDAVHDAAGVASLRELSSAQASQLIERLGGGELPNPPGRSPKPARRPPPARGVTRMISTDQAEQIERLGLLYFEPNDQALRAWLTKDFECPRGDPRELATAQRAGEVIAVLKQMLHRRGRGDPPHGPI
jgi:hypothetical protein